MKKIIHVVVELVETTLIAACFLTACSSSPKRSMQVSTVYSSASEMIESANGAILTGDYDKAGFFLSAAENQAMSIDNYDLLCAAALARCSLELSKNPPEVESARRYVDYARSIVNNSSNPKKQAALVTLSQVRVNAAQAGIEQTSDIKTSALFAELDSIKKDLKGDAYYESQIIQVEGDLYKLDKNYSQADKSYSAAAKAFTDNRYLSEIGICWYKAAQARSLAGNKDGALQAMEEAIFYDRAAENSLALGSDYYAVGLILLKGNPAAGEKERARQAFSHSAEIYASVNAEEAAKKSRDAASQIE
jgi:tetratricopeptide (TPR) repeat protein